MSGTRTIVPPFLFSEFCPLIMVNKSCMHLNSVTVMYIFLKLNRNVYQVKPTGYLHEIFIGMCIGSR